MTLNQQIALVKKFAQDHRQINTCEHRPEYDINAPKSVDGFVLWFFAEGSSVQNTSLRTPFVFTVMDVINKDKQNMDDILSDSLQILLDLHAYLLYQGDEYDDAGVQYNFDVERSGTFEPGIEMFNEEYAGHTVRLTFVQPFIYDSCQIPFINPIGEGIGEMEIEDDFIVS